MKRKLLFLILLAGLLGLQAGCAMKQATTEGMTSPADIDAAAKLSSTTGADGRSGAGVQEETVPDSPRLIAGPMTGQAVDDNKALAAGLRSVPFEYDQFLLSGAAMEILSANAAILKAKPTLRVRIEGHCDERGSDQYNIALGERRADAVRNYLISLGISAGRLETVSYGEEKPLDPGHDESAWVRNRRADFVPLP